jgi:type II secretory pathway component PulF
MANFTYKAIDAEKKIVEGSLTAKTRQEVAQILGQRGLSPLTVRTVTDRTLIRGSIPQIDKITFCRYLAVMLETGLSLSEGIHVLHEETKDPLMKRILGDMSYSLEQGQQLSSVFERYPDVFEPYFLTLTRVGEISGKLSEVFHHLELELRAEYSMNSKVKGALLYPSIVFTAMIAIGTLMFFFVLPQIGRVFLSLNLSLSAPTKFLFTVSISLAKYMVPILLAGLGVIVASVFALRNKRVRLTLIRLVRPVPLVRNLIKKIDLARLNRIFSTLLRSAVPITEALEISLSSLTWYEYRELSSVLPDDIRKGKSLSVSVKEHKVFPPLMVQMIAAGEKSATLDATLSDLATFYEEEVEEELKNLTQILEPILMLLVGIAVGAMILSIIAPIYSVVGSFQEAAGGKGR